MPPAAAAIAGPLISGAMSAQGGKKAAGQQAGGPQIPSQFGPSFTNALSFLNQGIRGGLPQFGGPFVAGLNPLQQGALGQGAGLLGAGSQGLFSALRTSQQISESGLDAGTIELINKKLAPYFAQQRGDVMGGLRESQAQGGRFFSSGAIGDEGQALTRLASQQQASVMPLALQSDALRLQGAGQTANIFGQGVGALGGLFGLGGGARDVEQAKMTAQFNEFIRTSPQAAISLLSQLASGAPLSYAPQAPNFMQTMGAAGSSMFSSPAFLQFLGSLGGGNTD